MLTGGLAAGLNWGSRFIFSVFFSLEVSVVLAFFVGLISAFIMMRYLVFDGKTKPVVPQMGMFVLINLLALLQTFFITILLAQWLFPKVGIYENKAAIAHLVGVLFPVFTSYLGHKFLTFRPS